MTGKRALTKLARRYHRHPAGTGKGGQFAPKPTSEKAPTFRELAALRAQRKAEAQEPQQGVPPYTKVKRLGKGVFGTVDLTERGTAVKQVSLNKVKTYIGKNGIDNLRREAQAYEELGALGIAPRLIARDEFPSKMTGQFQMELEFLAGYKTMGKDGGIPAPSSDRQRDNMRSAVLRMHQAGWLHGDIHDTNVMVGPNDEVRLIDMGFARKFEPSERDRGKAMRNFDDFVIDATHDATLVYWGDKESPGYARYQRLEDDANAIRNKYMDDRGNYPPATQAQAYQAMQEALGRFRK